ncbi:MAG TPA: hypothetical protein VFS08_00385 [Gemmatimonadaceae bacterium]|nr:hypothetical protein [Gemmatimonadaceae bacterium]
MANVDEGARERPDPRQARAGQDEPQHGGATSPWHWAAVVLGAMVVLATVAILVWDGLHRREHPTPRISLAVDTVVTVPGGFAVRVRARNDGGRTATDVQLRGELRHPGLAPEQAETSIDYLPPGSVRREGLVFTRDPRRGRLELRVVGYSLP